MLYFSDAIKITNTEIEVLLANGQKLYGKNLSWKTVEELPTKVSSSPLGNWNGNLFFVNHKKCLIFTNNQTAYSVVTLDVKKQDMSYVEPFFQKRVFEQFQYDLHPTEQQVAYASTCLKDRKNTKTSNYQKILGTLHQFIDLITYEAYRQVALQRVNP